MICYNTVVKGVTAGVELSGLHVVHLLVCRPRMATIGSPQRLHVGLVPHVAIHSTCCDWYMCLPAPLHMQAVMHQFAVPQWTLNTQREGCVGRLIKSQLVVVCLLRCSPCAGLLRGHAWTPLCDHFSHVKGVKAKQRQS
jgi:hypothetical protein